MALPPNTGFQPTVPAGALKIGRFLKNIFRSIDAFPAGSAAEAQAVGPHYAWIPSRLLTFSCPALRYTRRFGNMLTKGSDDANHDCEHRAVYSALRWP